MRWYLLFSVDKQLVERVVSGCQDPAPIHSEWVGAVAAGERLLTAHLWTGGRYLAGPSPTILPLSRSMDPGWERVLARGGIRDGLRDGLSLKDHEDRWGVRQTSSKRRLTFESEFYAIDGVHRGEVVEVLGLMEWEWAAGMPYELAQARQARRGLYLTRFARLDEEDIAFRSSDHFPYSVIPFVRLFVGGEIINRSRGPCARVILGDSGWFGSPKPTPYLSAELMGNILGSSEHEATLLS